MKTWMRPWSARNGCSEECFKMPNNDSVAPGVARGRRQRPYFVFERNRHKYRALHSYMRT